MAQVRIERSLKEVWQVFTDVSTWKDWWGGDLKSVQPEWQIGATAAWGGGGKATICDFQEYKRVGLKGTYGEVVFWAFIEEGGATIVSMGEKLEGSALISDAGARQAEFADNLNQLKRIVETANPTARPEVRASDSSRSQTNTNDPFGLTEKGLRWASFVEDVTQDLVAHSNERMEWTTLLEKHQQKFDTIHNEIDAVERQGCADPRISRSRSIVRRVERRFWFAVVTTCRFRDTRERYAKKAAALHDEETEAGEEYECGIMYALCARYAEARSRFVEAKTNSSVPREEIERQIQLVDQWIEDRRKYEKKWWQFWRKG